MGGLKAGHGGTDREERTNRVYTRLRRPRVAEGHLLREARGRVGEGAAKVLALEADAAEADGAGGELDLDVLWADCVVSLVGGGEGLVGCVAVVGCTW